MFQPIQVLVDAFNSPMKCGAAKELQRVLARMPSRREGERERIPSERVVATRRRSNVEALEHRCIEGMQADSPERRTSICHSIMVNFILEYWSDMPLCKSSRP
jgi:hypothetical protein